SKAGEWWEKVKKQGEEAYLCAQILTLEGSRYSTRNHLTKLLARDHPRSLPKLYRTVLDERPEVQSWWLADALFESTSDARTKTSLFERGARHPRLEHRLPALQKLAKLNPDRFVVLLIETLNRLPTTPSGSYDHCVEAAFATLVTQTDDHRAWSAL